MVKNNIKKSKKSSEIKRKSADYDSIEINKIYLFILLIFCLVLAIMLILEIYSSRITERQLREELKQFYLNSPLGITENGNINIEAFKQVKEMSPQEIKEIMDVGVDFCVYVVDSNNNLLGDEEGNPLSFCSFETN
ncbi:MAG: hypothetical protein PWQ87_757 [Candidatus Woesearchaeota archaeon]|nr:hypothetical protein [Candidatus Woesearchaeota archaeon]